MEIGFSRRSKKDEGEYIKFDSLISKYNDTLSANIPQNDLEKIIHLISERYNL